MTFYKQNLSGKSLNHSVAISLVVDVGGANFLFISDNLQTNSHTAENHSISLSCLSKGLIVVLQATLEEQANMFREIMVISRDIMEQQVGLCPCCLQLIKTKFFMIRSSICDQQPAWDALTPALKSIFWASKLNIWVSGEDSLPGWKIEWRKRAASGACQFDFQLSCTLDIVNACYEVANFVIINIKCFFFSIRFKCITESSIAKGNIRACIKKKPVNVWSIKAGMPLVNALLIYSTNN